MNRGTARGLPARIYLPVLATIVVVVLAIVAYFLRVGLSVTGAALGPEGMSNAGQTAGAPNGVGGGTSLEAPAGGPPAPIQRILTELRGRVARNPHDAAALEGLGSLYLDAGKFEQAIGYERRALALDPQNLGLRTDYAAALHGAGEDSAAAAQLRIVLNANPAFPPALLETGVVASASGRRAAAIDAYRRFLRAAPNDQRAGDARAALRNLGAQ